MKNQTIQDFFDSERDEVIVSGPYPPNPYVNTAIWKLHIREWQKMSKSTEYTIKVDLTSKEFDKITKDDFFRDATGCGCCACFDDSKILEELFGDIQNSLKSHQTEDK